MERELPGLGVEIAMFTDDVPILVSDINKEKAAKTAQRLADIVAD